MRGLAFGSVLLALAATLAALLFWLRARHDRAVVEAQRSALSRLRAEAEGALATVARMREVVEARDGEETDLAVGAFCGAALLQRLALRATELPAGSADRALLVEAARALSPQAEAFAVDLLGRRRRAWAEGPRFSSYRPTARA